MARSEIVIGACVQSLVSEGVPCYDRAYCAVTSKSTVLEFRPPVRTKM